MADWRRPAPRARPVVEPVGYAVTQFLASAGLVAGVGLAPDGLALVGAATLLSMIDLRRFRASNPGLIPETAEGFGAPMGKVLSRYAAIRTGLLLALAVAAVILMVREDSRAAVIGPALLAGLATLVMNWRLKRALMAAGVGLRGSGPGGPLSQDSGDPDDGQSPADGEPEPAGSAPGDAAPTDDADPRREAAVGLGASRPPRNRRATDD